MKQATIKLLSSKPVDSITLMGGHVLKGTHRLKPYGFPTENAWIAYKVDQSGKAHSHKVIDGDKVLIIDPSNEDPTVVGTQPEA